MANKNMSTLVQYMKKLDFCMMNTVNGRGEHFSRPMSNNRQVDYDGDSWFFSFKDTGKVRQIESNHLVSLVYHGEDMLFIQVYGEAQIIEDKTLFEKHWVNGLERWFEKGIETPGPCLIKVKAKRAQYWHKEKEDVVDF